MRKAPSVQCSPMSSAASTIRNSDPSSRPGECCGTLSGLWTSETSGGSTREVSSQQTTAKPAILATTTSIPVADTS